MFAYDFCFIALREHKRPEGNVALMKYTQALFFLRRFVSGDISVDCFIVKESEKRRGGDGRRTNKKVEKK
jgi:hypothetical protein